MRRMKDRLIAAEAKLRNSVPKEKVDVLIDKNHRAQERLKGAVARAEARVKLAYSEVAYMDDQIVRLIGQRDKLEAQLQEKELLLKQRAKEVSANKGKPTTDKKLVLLLARVKKHLTNPRTKAPYKGAEALCKDLDRAMRP